MSEPVRNEERQLLAGILNGCLLASVVLLVAVVIILRPTEKPRPTRLICMMNLKTLSTYLAAYADDHRGDYPPAERWCDVLVDAFGSQDREIRDCLRCPVVKKEPCSYAMNPNAGPRQASDVVLLFESKPGWNQSGGPELLTTENHQGKGCSVLFTDLHVEFVKTEDLSGLKWTDADTADVNQPAGSSADTRN